ncbi:hypothetical protein [Bacillus sp. P14.5]|uniref:hypothetical protein n=1 Tax=Bacillus sp. P14.5 TaxID=1983400 RepID=UPI001963EF99|nr:hypothetical protein [Bacillus sp. P14.5]
MGKLSTGPIENRLSSGVRPTQQVTAKFINENPVNSSTVLVQGYYLNGSRTQYVLETITLSPNQVFTKDYYANFNGYLFTFTIEGAAAENTRISFWGKNAGGQIIASYRLVSDELESIQTSITDALAYGSLYGSPEYSLSVSAGEKLIFSKIGPYSGMTPNTINNEIEIGHSGVYTIAVSFGARSLFPNPEDSVFSIYINEEEEINSRMFFRTDEPLEIDNISKNIQILLNEGDTVSIKAVSAPPTVQYINPSLVVTRIV